MEPAGNKIVASWVNDTLEFHLESRYLDKIAPIWKPVSISPYSFMNPWTAAVSLQLMPYYYWDAMSPGKHEEFQKCADPNYKPIRGR